MSDSRSWTAPNDHTPAAPPKGDINSVPWQPSSARPLVFKGEFKVVTRRAGLISQMRTLSMRQPTLSTRV
jgi:hypothetical protein